MNQEPEVTRHGALDMQVCVPESWSDEAVMIFASGAYLCGTTNGWQIRRAGSPALAGAPERAPCSARPGFVHVMLDA